MAEDSGQALKYDEDGNLIEMFLAADIDGDGDTDLTDFGLLLDAYDTCESDPNYNPDADLDGDNCVGLSDMNILLDWYGAENNAIQAAFEWDAENRLIAYTPQAPIEGAKRVEFKYDYLGRRVEKKVYDWDPTLNGGAGDWEADPSLWRRFVYYNWLLLEELDVNASGTVTGVAKKYTWGLDLAGLNGSVNDIESAGGIGGLLGTRDVGTSTSYIHFYDANGNVGQVVDVADGSIDAKYEYDAYGDLLVADGDYADANPFRFSTKYYDAETELYYFGFRYYLPGLGRWVKRDPIEEQDDVALYAYIRNTPQVHHDPLGLKKGCCPWVDYRPPKVWWEKKTRKMKFSLNPGGPLDDVEIDFQILRNTIVGVHLIGKDDDAVLALYWRTDWQWPGPRDLSVLTGLLPKTACRKIFVPKRKCRRTCSEGYDPDTGDQEFFEETWIRSGMPVYVFGRTVNTGINSIACDTGTTVYTGGPKAKQAGLPLGKLGPNGVPNFDPGERVPKCCEADD